PLERIWHRPTLLPVPVCLEGLRAPVPRSVDSVGSNTAGFGVRLRLASFRLPSGRTLSHLPANDGVDENHRVWPRVPRALFDEARVEA
ncbi:hypothetical protein NPIL_400361, partial [Nephila pilipes]